MTNFASITQQEIIRLLDSYDALVVRDLLIQEYGYVPLEGSGFSENGAYFIHPIDWPKPDISSAKLCWPAMEKQGLQFIGLNGPNDIKYYDGLLDGKPCELKFYKPEIVLSEEKLVKKIKSKMSEANSQGAYTVIVVIDLEDYKYDWTKIQSRIDGTISTNFSKLKKCILLKR